MTSSKLAKSKKVQLKAICVGESLRNNSKFSNHFLWYFNDIFCSGQTTREIIVIDVLVCISFHDFFLAWNFLNFLAHYYML